MERPLSFRTAVQRLIAALTRMLRNPDTRALALVLGAGSVDAVQPSRRAVTDDPARAGRPMGGQVSSNGSDSRHWMM